MANQDRSSRDVAAELRERGMALLVVETPPTRERYGLCPIDEVDAFARAHPGLVTILESTSPETLLEAEDLIEWFGTGDPPAWLMPAARLLQAPGEA